MLDVRTHTDGGQTAEFISGQFFSEAEGAWRWKPVPWTRRDLSPFAS